MPSSRRAGWSAGAGSSGQTSVAHRKRPSADVADEGVEVHDGGAAGEHHAGAGRDERHVLGVQQVRRLGGHGGEDEEEGAAREDLVERCRDHARITDDRIRQPGVVAADGGRAEGLQQGQQLASDVAVAQDAHLRAAQQDGVLVAGRDVLLAALAEGAVLAADAARQVDGETEGVLGHGLRVDGHAGHHVHAAREGHLVVDVLEEVALDVEDAAQLRRAQEALSGQVRLADDGHDLRQAGIDGLLRRISLAIDDGVALVETPQGVVAEDALDRSAAPGAAGRPACRGRPDRTS